MSQSTPIQFVAKTKYLNNARAVVTHSIDDSTKYVPRAIDAMDKYGIKATIFIGTEADPAPEDFLYAITDEGSLAANAQGNHRWSRTGLTLPPASV